MMKKSILVIDDDESMRDLLADAFESFGYGVVAAVDGRDALDILNEVPFDLVICDLAMPRISGREFLKKVNPCLPVIIITGYGTAQTEDEMKSLGAAGYLAKPFGIAQGKALVEQILGEGKKEEETDPPQRR